MSLHELIGCIAHWLDGVQVPALLMMAHDQRYTDKSPFERIVIALAIQVATASIAVGIGVYVAVQVMDVRIKQNTDTNKAILATIAKMQELQQQRWDEYERNRVADAAARNAGARRGP